MNDVMRLFHGLDDRQARAFRRSIIPTLEVLRTLIVAEDAARGQRRPRNSGRNTGRKGEQDDRKET